MANIELQYYNGSSYEILYPKINWANNSGGTISSSYIPNLAASKITSGTFDIARIPVLNESKVSGVVTVKIISYTGTGTYVTENNRYTHTININSGSFLNIFLSEGKDSFVIGNKNIYDYSYIEKIGASQNGGASSLPQGSWNYGQYYSMSCSLKDTTLQFRISANVALDQETRAEYLKNGSDYYYSLLQFFN